MPAASLAKTVTLAGLCFALLALSGCKTAGPPQISESASQPEPIGEYSPPPSDSAGLGNGNGGNGSGGSSANSAPGNSIKRPFHVGAMPRVMMSDPSEPPPRRSSQTVAAGGASPEPVAGGSAPPTHVYGASRAPASVAGDTAAPYSPPDVKQCGMVKLYYATDRAWTGSTTQPKWFDHDWDGQSAHLTYGTCMVTIPVANHKTGRVEKPSVMNLELQEDPSKHVVVYHPSRLPHDEFFTKLGNEVQQRGEHEIVVFIHGFNNTFDDAASRLGVLAYDMDFNGVPVLYSWCSQGGSWGTASYLHDEEIVAKTVRPLSKFLAEVAMAGRAAGAKRVCVVAHSMGNRALVAALQAIATQKDGKFLFDEAVMAAPDVTEIGFASDEWPLLQGPARRLTLYASADDKALKASHDAHEFRRLGESGEGLLLLPGLDTVDATGCDFSLLGLNHSYFGGPEVLADLHLLTHQGLAPKDRKLIPAKLRDLSYWLFAKP